jgi:hypothetical protein
VNGLSLSVNDRFIRAWQLSFKEGKTTTTFALKDKDMPFTATIAIPPLLLVASIFGFSATTVAKQVSEDPASITGTVVDMHVSINPEWTVTNRFADIATDGTFEFKALAPGIYSLDVGINGYIPTPDSPQALLVERDRRNVIIHMARSP